MRYKKGNLRVFKRNEGGIRLRELKSSPWGLGLEVGSSHWMTKDLYFGFLGCCKPILAATDPFLKLLGQPSTEFGEGIRFEFLPFHGS